MAKIDFERPGSDVVWAASHKCEDAFPMGSAPCEPFAKPLLLEAEIVNAVYFATPNKELLDVDDNTQKRFEKSPSDVMREEQATASNDEDGTAHEHEKEACVVAVNVVAESQKEQDLMGYKKHEESKQPSYKQEIVPAGPISSRSCCRWIAGLIKRNQERSRMLDDAVTADPELQRALLESVNSSIAEKRVRLRGVMELYHAKLKPVQADGNCQFRALSLQTYGDESYHVALRTRVVEQLEAMPGSYADFVHEPYADYVKRMARDGEWGDNVTLQAASDVLGMDIHLLTDQPGAEFIEMQTKKKPCGPQQKPLCLTFLTEVHYDAAEIM